VVSAWISGAASGIGEAVARLFAEEGAAVGLADVQSDRGQVIAGEILSAGGRALFTKCDVSRSDEVRASIEQTAHAFGGLSIIVNCAGIVQVKLLHELDEADWDRLMAINLRGVFLTTRKGLALMLPGPGSIINISSILGLRGFWPGSPAASISYSTSKAGVIGFTRQVAAEYAVEKIRVNAIAPGWHGGTALGAERRAASSPADIKIFEEAIHARIPMKHRGVPDDLVGLVVYLASDASHYVTGQVIAHDGGWDTVVA